MAITLSSPEPTGTLLESLATLTMRALRVDLCVILLADPTYQYLEPRAWAPLVSAPEIEVRPIGVNEALFDQLRMDLQRGQIVQLSAHEAESINPLSNVQYEVLLPVPLVAYGELVGALLCYSGTPFLCKEEDQLQLAMIATQTALAIKHRQVVETSMAAQKTQVSSFLDELLSVKSEESSSFLFKRALSLGFDLRTTHLVARIHLVRDGQRYSSEEQWLEICCAVATRVQQALIRRYPGSLLDERTDELLCLVCPGQDSIEDVTIWLNRLLDALRQELQLCLFAGVSARCCALVDYQRGYAEANEALEVVQCLQDDSACICFERLGVYRYLYSFARTDTLRDQYQSHIAAIAEYDLRRKTNLLDTLEMYLESGGNITKTASMLNVHRNTLLQRLDRIETCCNLQLEEHTCWLPLLVALKIHRLRAHTAHCS